MDLAGQCKIDFEKWFEKHEMHNEHHFSNLGFKHYLMSFYAMHDSFKYGVYVDFFDSVNLHVSINHYKDVYWFDFTNKSDTIFNESDEYKTRNEAIREAIKQAKEIYIKNNK